MRNANNIYVGISIKKSGPEPDKNSGVFEGRIGKRQKQSLN